VRLYSHQEMQEIIVDFNNIRGIAIHLPEGESGCNCNYPRLYANFVDSNVISGPVTYLSQQHMYKKSTEL
jgi:hypothetical protein